VADVNIDRLRELAGYLRDACRQLHELGKLEEAEFLSDAKTVNSAKYLLIVATEAALDICGHVVAKRGGRSPEDYADCMRILGELGVLDEDLRMRMGKMARFRNLLVHLYWKVEDRGVYRVLRERLGDFDEYLGAVGRFVESSL
jgi:uncharacterized protein YutE (UPF0331/DUF86 family)